MSQGLLEYHKAQGTAYELAMNEVRFLRYGQDRLTSIGTANLNGCSAVMVVSHYGAILAHISPLPDDHLGDPNAGGYHVQAKMDILAALYRANRQYFPTGGSNWVVCAVFQGELALPHQQELIRDNLTELGLSYSLRTYVAERRYRGDPFPGQGTVFVDGNGSQPTVYVEDVVVSNDSPQTGSSSSAAGYVTESSAYAAPSSSRYEAESSPYAAEDDAQKGNSSAESYYYVRDKQYFFLENGQSIRQPKCPKNVWIFNDKGWSGSESRSMRWRYYDGENVSYTP